MNKLVQSFKNYFDIDVINIDKKVVITTVSTALILTVYTYYMPFSNFNQLLNDIGLSSLSSIYSAKILVFNNFQLQYLIHWTFSCFFLFFLIPIFIIKVIYKEKLSDNGLTFNIAFKHYGIYVLFVLVMFPVVFIASKTQSFQSYYPLLKINDKSEINKLLFWEFLYFFQFLFVEFFFRGFLLHTIKHKFGYYSIFIAMIPYCMSHFGKPFGESVGAIIAGCVLGFLSLNTRTIFLSIFLHYTIAVTMDFCALWNHGFFK
ncbi:MAG: CPBP family intramembrane glutamic endopeptidase [Chitinophagales bacterium]